MHTIKKFLISGITISSIIANTSYGMWEKELRKKRISRAVEKNDNHWLINLIRENDVDSIKEFVNGNINKVKELEKRSQEFSPRKNYKAETSILAIAYSNNAKDVFIYLANLCNKFNFNGPLDDLIFLISMDKCCKNCEIIDWLDDAKINMNWWPEILCAAPGGNFTKKVLSRDDCKKYINMPDRWGETPLLRSFRSINFLEKIEQLLAADADIYAQDTEGWTVLMRAITSKNLYSNKASDMREGRLILVHLFLNHAAKIRKFYTEEWYNCPIDIINAYINPFEDGINLTNNNGETALKIAKTALSYARDYDDQHTAELLEATMKLLEEAGAIEEIE